MNLYTATDHLAELMFTQSPPIERVESVDKLIYGLSKNTLDESAKIIRENPELAKQMGVSP